VTQQIAYEDHVYCLLWFSGLHVLWLRFQRSNSELGVQPEYFTVSKRSSVKETTGTLVGRRLLHHDSVPSHMELSDHKLLTKNKSSFPMPFHCLHLQQTLTCSQNWKLV
jgi:hypothetical protein